MQQVRFEWQENGRVQERTLSLDPRVLIGRLHSCDLVLHDQTVSKYHAQIYRQNGILYIHNLSQVNPILLNGDAVLQNQVAPLPVGTTLRLSRAKVKLLAPQPVAPREFKVKCSHCGRAVDGTKYKDCPHCGYNLASAETLSFALAA